MPRNIQKSLQDYLSKIKATRSPQIQLPSKKWILKGCKHPRTPSFSIDNNKKKNNPNNNNNNKKVDEATLADIDRFLFENFKSLYLGDDEETDDNNKGVSELQETKTHEKAPRLASFSFDSSEEQPPLDLYGSNRFFMTRGFSGTTGSTSTLNDSSSSNPKEDQNQVLPDNCVVVLAPSSPSPYEEFRRSMRAVVEARLRNGERVDWDFMEEVLFCCINLNEKKSHKFILSAFVDLITDMRRRRSETAPAPKQPRSVRTVRIGREVRKKTKEVTLEF